MSGEALFHLAKQPIAVLDSQETSARYENRVLRVLARLLEGESVESLEPQLIVEGERCEAFEVAFREFGQKLSSFVNA
jgi:hypothetical protein